MLYWFSCFLHYFKDLRNSIHISFQERQHFFPQQMLWIPWIKPALFTKQAKESSLLYSSTVHLFLLNVWYFCCRWCLCSDRACLNFMSVLKIYVGFESVFDKCLKLRIYISIAVFCYWMTYICIFFFFVNSIDLKKNI